MSVKTDNRPADLHPLLRMRYSPRAFSPASLTPAQIQRIFEAGQWSASCFNAQPWRFVVAAKEDAEGFARILSTLVPANQAWAEKAALLGIAVAQSNFEMNGNPNRFAAYDAGQAMAQVSLQTEAEGFHCHQMGGFDAAKAREVLGVPQGYELMAAFAIGQQGDPASLTNEGHRAQETAPGQRKALDTLLFHGMWPK